MCDSRFVVRYFRKSLDNRLLFGGREVYTSSNPKDMAEAIRRQIVDTYPALKDVQITHAWGGNVGITLPRHPFVREVMPGVTSIGGYSGHGVMLSNYCGKLYADMVLGNRTRARLSAGPRHTVLPRRAAHAKPSSVPRADLVCAQRQDVRRLPYRPVAISG